jgi:hypothetical protein
MRLRLRIDVTMLPLDALSGVPMATTPQHPRTSA